MGTLESAGATGQPVFCYFLFPISKKNAARAAFFSGDPRLCRQVCFLNQRLKMVTFRAL